MISDQVIAILNLATLVTIMLSMGLQVKFDSVVASARQIRLTTLCVVANFVLVPLVALGLLYTFRASPLVSVGFFILAVCPAAPVGPPLTLIAKGNLSVAVGMMIVLAALSAVLSPLLLSLMLMCVAEPNGVHINFWEIIRTLLVAQLLPLAFGLAVHRCAPRLTKRVARPITLLSNVLMLALIVAIIYAQFQTLSNITIRAWTGMMVLLVASLVIGWLCGGRDSSDRNALAMTTGPRNAAVGLAIATRNFPGTPAVTAVVAYGLASMIGTLAVAIWLGKVNRANQSLV